MTSFVRDLRAAWRSLSRRPALLAAAVATLAVGLAATTAVFSLVRAVLLHPLPYRDSGRLVVMWQTDPKAGVPFVEASIEEYDLWRASAKVFEGVAAMTAANYRVNLSGRGDAVQLQGASVSANFFPLLGVRPELGRSFRPEEDTPNAPIVILISHGLWVRQLGSDASIVGRAIQLDGAPATVVGVLPDGAALPAGADVWATAEPTVAGARDLRIFKVLGKRRPGASLAQTRAAMDKVAADVERARPGKNRGIGVSVVPLEREIYGDTGPALRYLFGAVAFVLLIACANVANLLLARAADRRREVAIRTALGASRGAIVRQLLTESALLSLAGAAIGLPLALLAVRLLLPGIPASVPRMDRIGLDLPIVAFALAAASASVFLAGLVPAYRLSAASPEEALRERSGRSSEGAGGGRLRGGLVAAEVALSMALLVSAALMVDSYRRLAALAPGFDPDRVVTARVSLGGTKYPDVAARTAYYKRLLERLGALPGVRSAGLVLLRPLVDPVGWDYSFTVEGQTAEEQSRNPASNYEAASASYFETLRIPVKRGRLFDGRDGEGSPRVVIVSESMAKRFWPGRDPIGGRLKFGRYANAAPWHTVVGVVGDVRYREWSGIRPDIYVPYAHWNFGRMDVLVRTSGDPDAIVPLVRAVSRELDPDQPLADVTTMDRVVRDATGGARFTSRLLSAFGLAALLLAAVGISGVIAAWASARTREFGIRMALGAGPREVRGLVLGHALRLLGVGLGAGLLLSAVATRGLSGLLFGVRPGDPGAFLRSAALLSAVALAAGYLPARRAARTDPMVSLRRE